MKHLLVILVLLPVKSFAIDTAKVAVVLAQFPNLKHQKNYGINLYNTMLFNMAGAWRDTTPPTIHPDNKRIAGSMADYWWNISDSTYRVIGGVVNPDSAGTGLPLWITLDSASTYYTTSTLFLEAVYKACASGYFDTTYTHFVVLHAGPAIGGVSNRAIIGLGWLSSEHTEGFFPQMSVHAHEGGHAFHNFDDEYFGFNNQSPTSTYDLMGIGGGIDPDGAIPAPPNPIYLHQKGWCIDSTISTGQYNFAISYNAIPRRIFKIQVQNENAYFLLMTRLRQGYDEWVPNNPSNFASQSGVLEIWYHDFHIDALGGQANDNMDLIEADNTGAGASNQPVTPLTDYWPANGVRQDFRYGLTPAPLYWRQGDPGLTATRPARFALFGIHRLGDSTIVDTIAFPPVVTQLFATAVGQDSAILPCVVNPNALVNTVRAFWGEIPGNPVDSATISTTLTGITPTGLSHTIPRGKLTPNRTYFHFTRSYNSPGNGAQWMTQSAELSFVTGTAGVNMTITTDSVNAITPSSARAWGTVNPNGSLTTVRLLRGTSAGVYTDSVTLGTSFSGFNPIVLSHQWTTLAGSTTYYYRFRAYNNIPQSKQGIERSFSTGVAVVVPVVFTDAATHVTQTTADLNGRVNPGNGSTRVRFAYGTASGILPDTVTVDTLGGNTLQSVSFPLTGRTPGTEYFYRIIANNSAGQTAGNQQSFTTLAVTHAPVITILGATGIGLNGATLNARVNAGNLSTTVRFLWSRNPGTYLSGDSLLATQSPVSGTGNTDVSRTIAGLLPGETIYFIVRAYNTDGNVQSAETSFVATSITRPTVSLDSVTVTGAFSARYHFTVNPHGSETIVVGRWARTVNVFEDSTRTYTAGHEEGDTTFFVDIDSVFLAGTQYFGDGFAFNAGGTTISNRDTFTTAVILPSLVSNSAVAQSITARLFTSFLPNGGATTLKFLWGTQTGVYTDSVTVGVFNGLVISTSAEITGLDGATGHFARTVLINSAGRLNAPEFTFTTTGGVDVSTQIILRKP